MSGISTVALHADREVHPTRAVAPPIYQTATFWAEDAEQFAQAAVNRRGSDFYTRYGNPNHAQVCAVVAELEHTEAAMVTASGMAALTTAVLALVSAGDHVIGQKSTYGGTASVLLNLLPRLGISTSLVDQADPEAFERALTPDTRLILVESPSNPLLQVTDLRAVAKLARAHDVLTMADNTFATPVNQRPADFGIDLVWHSATKYLNGHTDVSAGVLAGRRDPGPDLGCRPAHRCRARPVRRVAAAARPAHPAAAHATAQRQRPGARGGAERPPSRGPGALSRPGDPPAARAGASQMSGFGGVLGIELAGGFEAADVFLGRLRYARRSASLGGVDSLAVHPASMWRGMLSEDQIAASGVPLGLVRLAAGTEDTPDLVADALAAADAGAARRAPDHRRSRIRSRKGP